MDILKLNIKVHKIVVSAFLCLSIFSTILFGILGIKLYKEDGGYVYKNETIDLNKAISRGEYPEPGEYVTVKLNLTGKGFEAVDEDEYTIYPVVVMNEDGSSDSSKPVVLAVSVGNDDSVALSDYVDSSKSYIDRGKDSGKKEVIELSGRYESINKNLDLYHDSISESGFSEDKYDIQDKFINTNVNKYRLKRDIMMSFTLCFFSIAIAAFSIFWIFIYDDFLNDNKTQGEL